jgi:predicted permease
MTWWQDLRYSIRMLRKAPGFSVAMIFTLALTIGANAAIFSVVQAVLLRQLPFEEPDRLMAIWSRRVDGSRGPLNIPDFIDVRDRNRTFEQFAGFAAWSPSLTSQGDAERLPGVRTTANVFRVLGVSAAVGRTLVPDDDRPGAGRVVVVTDGLWRRRFGGELAIVGRSILLDGVPYTVVGVLPPGFFFPIRDAEIATPFVLDGDPLRAARGSVNFVRMVARLKPGITRASAEDDVTSIARQLQAEHPQENARKNGGIVVPFADDLVGPVRPALLALLAAVVGVLLIACANLASLLLARGATRRQEMAIRLATGATRRRLVRQLLTETTVFGIAGGGLGLAIAVVGVRLLVAIAPADLPRLNEVAIDGGVVAFTAGLSLLSGIVFGTLPAVVISRANLSDALKADARGVSEGRDRRRTRGGLVAAEVALALLLLIAVGLLARSFLNVLAVRPGFDPRHVLTARLSLPRVRYDAPEKVAAYEERLLASLVELPGVESAGAVSLLPLNGQVVQVPFTPADRGIPRERVPYAQYRIATPGYFHAMGIPIVRGRSFDARDTSTMPAVVVINESLARRFFPDRDPIGARLSFDDTNSGPRVAEIIAVVGDVKQLALDSPTTMDLYVPYAQLHADAIPLATANMFWVIRTQGRKQGEPAVYGEAVRQKMQAVDSLVPIVAVRGLDQQLSASMAPRRFNMLVLSVFALAALVLATSGIYATLSYSVSQRAREIAIRLALGAQRRDILWLVVMQGLTPAVIGVLVGLAAAVALTRSVASLLFEVSPTDPATFAALAGVLLLVAFVACIIPGLRATRTTSR